MGTAKSHVTSCLQVIYKDMLEAAILLMTYLVDCFKCNKRFKSKRFQHDWRNKSIKNFNKACIMQI